MIKVDDRLKFVLQRDPFTGDEVIMELYKEIAIQCVNQFANNFICSVKYLLFFM